MPMEPLGLVAAHHAASAPPPDLNFNSPHHHSSQDGSFIQDEAEDMQLIMDWSPGGGATIPRVGDKTTPFVPTSVLTSSWLSRAQATWAGDRQRGALDLDANIPDLDLDSRGRKAATDSTGEMDASFWEESPIQKDWNQNLKESVLELSLSPSQSLFSSEGLVSTGDDELRKRAVLEEALHAVAGAPAFISTDSLDMSALMEDGELEAACATRKRDYMLTFEGVKSTIIASTMDYYADAALTDASDQVVSPRDCFVELPPEPPPPDPLQPRSVTTWGRIRLSCQLEGLSSPTECSAPKSHSLPNLSRSPLPSAISGAGENMLSGETVPIYNLSESMSSSQYRSCLPNGDGRSLLRMFQNKMSTRAALEARERQEMGDSQDSSGYITGEHQDAAAAELSAAVASANAEIQETSVSKASKIKAPSLPTTEEETPRADNQDPTYQPTTSRVQDYEYSEFYVNGRYIDVNHNEIGYTPPSTHGTQHLPAETTSEATSPRSPTSPPHDRWITLASPRLTRIAPIKPPRTFATLLETQAGGTETIASSTKSDASTSPTLIRASSSVSVSKLKESATQVPVYVVDQSVQTSCWDSGRLVKTLSTASTTSIWSPSNPSAPVYVHTRSFSDMGQPPVGAVPKGPIPANLDLDFLKLGFSPPALFPDAPPFPLALLSQSSMDPALADELRPPIPLPVSPPEDRLPEERTGKPRQPFQLDLGPPLGNLALPSVPSLLARGGLGTPGSLDSAYPSAHSSAGRDTEAKRRPEEAGPSGVARGDSGLGCSGPSHIQDWESLAALLPKDVVSTCSFFKANNLLLKEPECSIDKPRSRFGRFGRRAGSKASRPVSEPSFERWRRLMPKTIYESIMEEECDAETGRFRQHTSCRSAGYSSRRSNRGVPSRLSHSVACCPGGCQHSCGSCRHDCDPCGRRGTPRWRYSDAGHDSGSDSDILDAELCSSGWSSEEESLRPQRKRARPSSLDTGCRRVRSVASVREEMESSFLRGDNITGRQRLERGQSDFGLGTTTVEAASPSSKVCTTCFRVRSPSDERPPLWALKELRKWPDYTACSCETSDVLDDMEKDARRRRRSQNLVFFLSGLRSEKMCEEEMAIRKTPLYLQKKQLVDIVLKECEELVRQFSGKAESREGAEAALKAASASLIPALKHLLSDGLLPACSLWNVIKGSSTLGPATKSIHQLVSELKELSMEEEGQVGRFFSGLLGLNSLDCWLSYLALKDRVLDEHYEDGAFMRRATTAYRSQLARLMGGLQGLSLLPLGRARPTRLPRRSSSVPLGLRQLTPAIPKSKSSLRPDGRPRSGLRSPSPRYALVPTRLPADSRVPKSSSVPSKLTLRAASPARASPSRIPVLKDSPSLPNKTMLPYKAPLSKPRFVCTIDKVAGNKSRNVLACDKGETLELVGTPLGRFLRCRRNGEEGYVPRELATFVTFL